LKLWWAEDAEPLQAGDRIFKTTKAGTRMVYVIAFPAYTRAGKVRKYSVKTGGIQTAWWSRTWLPEKFSWKPASDFTAGCVRRLNNG